MDLEAARTATNALFDLAGDMKSLFWQGSRAAAAAGADPVSNAQWWVLEHPGIQSQQDTFRHAVDLLADRGLLEEIAPEHIPGWHTQREAEVADVEAGIAHCAHRSSEALEDLRLALT